MLHVYKNELTETTCIFERKLKMVIQQQRRQSDDHNPLFSRLDAL